MSAFESAFELGKSQALASARLGFKKGSTCLDVGANEWIWHWFLSDHFKMDAVAVGRFEQYIKHYHLDDLYENVFDVDIKDFKYEHYDLIIFSDILKRLTVEDAQKVLEYAYNHCNDFIVRASFEHEQNNNEYEIDFQNDLTLELVRERYQMLEPIDFNNSCAYYHKINGNLL